MKEGKDQNAGEELLSDFRRRKVESRQKKKKKNPKET